MSESKMKALSQLGQSIWLDYIDRPLLETDKLKNMINDGLRGMTSNPSIFNNAIGSSNDYDTKIQALKEEGKTTFAIYDALTILDIQEAADQFNSVYQETNGLDGYVSLEINPQIAHDVDQQISEGKRLWKTVDRKNVMIKVPSTEAGLKVIEALTAKGINVNATLIFSLKQYEDVANSYYRGLAEFAKNQGDISKVRSVASVFISRIDAAIDKMIDEKISKEADDQLKGRLTSFKGKAAVANARLIYAKSKELELTEQASNLLSKGACVQRVLWASTGTKNPSYSDIKYVTELISSPTVNTLPEKTLNAFLDHGNISEGFPCDDVQAQAICADLNSVEIDINQICADLLIAGVESFDSAFEELFDSIEKKAQALAIKS